MLTIAVIVTWLVVVVLLVALARAAALGDRQIGAHADADPRPAAPQPPCEEPAPRRRRFARRPLRHERRVV